jgi:F0F1-type ATP synthase membrane subunit b/b'
MKDLNPAVMKAVETLDYRVTVGDVAANAGLDLNVAQQGMIALAANTQAHLQVSEAGEIAYEFPKNFRAVLRNKFWRLRLQETWARIWAVLFYIIRISFGILLLLSILIIVAAIIVLVIAISSSQRDNERSSNSRGGGGLIFIPRFWIGDLFYFFDFNPGRRRRQVHRQRPGDDDEMNFLEAVFSFLFGDGNPNADLEEARWQMIGKVIRNQGGAVAAEQIAPYLDDLGSSLAQEDGDYMLPVLTRFNGIPQVSPQGNIIYHFPELQVTARDRKPQPVSAYLKESPWKFSEASSGKLTLAAGLGIFNFVAAIVLGALMSDPQIVAELGGFIAFVNSIYWLLLAYGTAFLAVPAVRYFWVQRRNSRIAGRNDDRQTRAAALNAASPAVQDKIEYARQFASQTVVSADDLAYTTEKDLTEQEAENRDKLDAEWQQRLNASDSST